MTEPVSGWVDNFNGPVGLMIPIGIGFSRILLGEEFNPLNFVPVDYVSNSLISSMAQSALEFEKTPASAMDQVPIFNYGVDKKTCLQIRGVIDYGIEICSLYPMENTVWAPATNITSSILVYKFYFYILQLLPGLFAELFLRIFNYKFR